MTTLAARPLFESALVKRALIDAFIKLSPIAQLKNPVMFVVFIGSILTSALWVQALVSTGEAPAGFILAIAVWLWFTLLFANFAKAIAEGRGKAQAQALRGAKRDLGATLLEEPRRDAKFRLVGAPTLKRGDIVLVKADDTVPGDGEVIEGVASVDESAITGESAPVIRESGGDRSSVTGGTRVLSDWLVVRISANAGEAFIDRMIAMVEGAKRQKTPNEIALAILLAALDAGADDFVTMPFGVGELGARLRVALRHAGGSAQLQGQPLKPGEIEIDLERREVRAAGCEIHLTPIEFRLLGVLVRHAGMVLTHRHLLREVWGPAFVDQSHYLRIYMKQSRDKLEPEPTRPRFLITETGVGYRIKIGD